MVELDRLPGRPHRLGIRSSAIQPCKDHWIGSEGYARMEGLGRCSCIPEGASYPAPTVRGYRDQSIRLAKVRT